MIGIFKQKNPGNNLMILVYGLVLKLNYIIRAPQPLRQEEDHYLYTLTLRLLDPLHIPSLVFGVISFALLYIQAILINRVCLDQKMLAKPTYLPAMCYMLLTSLFAEWNYFSAPLLVNTFLILLFYRMVNLYNIHKPLTAIFNIGLLMGIVTLLYQPAIIFVVMIPFTLFIMRPFRIREWLIGFLGVTTPYYFLALEPLFTNRWIWKHLLPSISMDFPAIPTSIYITIAILLLVAPFIVGGYFVQGNLNKMLIQIRKGWSLVLLLLIISLFIILVNGGNNYVNWIFCLVPISFFHASAYFYPANKIFPVVLHWLTFAYALFIGYGIW
ncbi:MAG: hypothetical protein ABI687_13100 [Flavitalea sp.]